MLFLRTSSEVLPSSVLVAMTAMVVTRRVADQGTDGGAAEGAAEGAAAVKFKAAGHHEGRAMSYKPLHGHIHNAHVSVHKLYDKTWQHAVPVCVSSIYTLYYIDYTHDPDPATHMPHGGSIVHWPLVAIGHWH
jgi:hypothetical protein